MSRCWLVFFVCSYPPLFTFTHTNPLPLSPALFSTHAACVALSFGCTPYPRVQAKPSHLVVAMVLMEALCWEDTEGSGAGADAYIFQLLAMTVHTLAAITGLWPMQRVNPTPPHKSLSHALFQATTRCRCVCMVGCSQCLLP
jgi:hypothetical protein